MIESPFLGESSDESSNLTGLLKKIDIELDEFSDSKCKKLNCKFPPTQLHAYISIEIKMKQDKDGHSKFSCSFSSTFKYSVADPETW